MESMKLRYAESSTSVGRVRELGDAASLVEPADYQPLVGGSGPELA
jgi:hypothetical protein